jgi:hypothetical protein
MSDQPKNLWWWSPKNFDDRKNERKISWLELFYDLVYVAAIGQLMHHLNVDLFMGLVAIVLVRPVIIGVRSWVKFKYFGEKDSGVKNQDAGQVNDINNIYRNKYEISFDANCASCNLR